jgi:hypothetical protein
VENLSLQLIPEGVLLVAASCTGLYYRHMTEGAHRRTFVGTRTCIESRVKLECEKEQQEQLLLSVIPAYIAAEVSPDIKGPLLIKRFRSETDQKLISVDDQSKSRLKDDGEVCGQNDEIIWLIWAKEVEIKNFNSMDMIRFNVGFLERVLSAPFNLLNGGPKRRSCELYESDGFSRSSQDRRT